MPHSEVRAKQRKQTTENQFSPAVSGFPVFVWWTPEGEREGRQATDEDGPSKSGIGGKNSLSSSELQR